MSNFKKVLKLNKISVKNLAEKAGVSRQSIYFLCKNGIKNLTTAKKYATLLDVNVRDII